MEKQKTYKELLDEFKEVEKDLSNNLDDLDKSVELYKKGQELLNEMRNVISLLEKDIK